MNSIWPKADDFYEIDRLGTTPFMPMGPSGITVHYTACGFMHQAKNEMKHKKIGYHFIIDRDGTLVQTASLMNAVNHAGNAAWNGQSPNRTHVAVSLVSWGLLNSDMRAWEGTKVPFGAERLGKIWDIATAHQETKLKKLIGDLIAEYNILPLNICGHDECALPKGRKVDPGGVLSMTMAELRKEFSQ